MYYEVIDNSQTGFFPIRCTVRDTQLMLMAHCHQAMELIWVWKGSMVVTCDGETYTLRENDFYLFPPLCCHSAENFSPDCVRLVITVELSILGVDLGRSPDELSKIAALLQSVQRYSAKWPPELAQEIRTLMLQLYQEHKNRTEYWKFAVKTKLSELILQILRNTPKCRPHKRNEMAMKLQSLLEYIAMNYCRKLTLEACAEHMGFNPSYLSRYFHQHMGLTFQDYVKKLRINHAQFLLCNHDLSIGEAAFGAGFGDVKTFNKLFKQETGMTPTQYRATLEEP